MKYDLVIFDLDGVIVNSENLHFEAYRRAFEAKGMELTFDMYNCKLRSKGRYIGLAAILGDVGREEMNAIGMEKDKQFGQLIGEKPDLVYDDSIYLIERLTELGVRRGVATASFNGKDFLQAYELYDRFDYVVTAKDVKNNKPNPEIYMTCKRFFNVDDSRILVIEDSEAGIRAALDAGLNVAYILRDEYQSVSEEILANDRVTTFDSLRQIYEDYFRY